jgi:CO/xanthine dehydrogenase FAD-binding subunit
MSATMLRDVEVMRPRTVDEALRALDRAARDGEPLRPMAGCTDVLVEAHFGKPLPPRYLDVWSLRRELGGMQWREQGLELGALCTYATALEDPKFAALLPALASASALVGATQIQARGTFAGNVENGSPAADAAPVLMALDARVRLQSLSGSREVPLAQYYSGYRQTVRRADELIAALIVPAASLGRGGQWYRKVGTRAYQAITKVGMAGVFDWQDGQLADVRVVAVSMAATLQRCTAVERYLRGRSLPLVDGTALRQAQAQDLKPIDDVRSTAAYRAEVFARLVEEALRTTHG